MNVFSHQLASRCNHLLSTWPMLWCARISDEKNDCATVECVIIAKDKQFFLFFQNFSEKQTELFIWKLTQVCTLLLKTLRMFPAKIELTFFQPW